MNSLRVISTFICSFTVMISSSAYAKEGQSCLTLLLSASEKNKKHSQTLHPELYGFPNTPEGRLKLSRLYSRCLEGTPQSDHLLRIHDAQLKTTLMAISLGTSVVGYTVKNWEKPKDFFWFAQFGLGQIFGRLTKLFKDKIKLEKVNSKYKQTMDFFLSRIVDGAITVGTNSFNDYRKSQSYKVQKDSSHNSSQKSIEDYATELENNPKKFDEFYETLKAKIMYLILYLNDPHIAFGDIEQQSTLSSFTKEDFENPEMAPVILAAVLAQENARKNAILNTGNFEVDSFLFDSFYGGAKLSLDVAMTSVSRQILCLNHLKPHAGMMQMIGANILYQAIFADYYGVVYTLSKEFVIGSEENTVERGKTIYKNR